MRYEYNKKVEIKNIADLRESVGWPGMESEYKNPSLTNYYHVACYDDNDVLIGYAEVVSNGVSDAYIQDVMVNPNYQGKGIGTELMNNCISHLKTNNIYMISVIYGEADLKEFYEKFGFFTMLCGQMETRKLE